MARQRKGIMLSFNPNNPEAVAVVEQLRELPEGGRSAALWHWAAEYLAGRSGVLSEPEPVQSSGDDEEDELEAALDAL
jgi:hypothetical protein